MDEVADDPVLGFTQRGTHTTLTVHPGRLLDSNYSLNTADICPVGALTSNDFRFQMRVWFLKETASIDVNCGTGTNITIWTRENQIHRITPRQNDEVNSTWMPDSHRLNFHYIDAESRLTQPLLKESGQHRAASWQESLKAIQKQVDGLDGSQIGIVASGRMTNEELFLTRELAKKFGSDLPSLVAREGEADRLLVAADRNPNTTGAKLILGDDPYAGLGDLHAKVKDGTIRALFVFGEDLITDAGFEVTDFENLDFLVQAHHSTNPTAKAANIVLPTATFAEKRGSMVNLSGRIQRLNRALEPCGQARDDWEVLRELGAIAADSHHIEDVFKAMAEAVSEFEGLTLSKIGHQGLPIADTDHKILLLENERAAKAAGTIVG